VRNNEEGIATIVAALGERGVGRVALEAIGGYARQLTAALIEADVTVFMVKPRRIRPFARPKASSPRPTGWTRVTSVKVV
jgi:transposase